MCDPESIPRPLNVALSASCIEESRIKKQQCLIQRLKHPTAFSSAGLTRICLQSSDRDASQPIRNLPTPPYRTTISPRALPRLTASTKHRSPRLSTAPVSKISPAPPRSPGRQRWQHLPLDGDNDEHNRGWSRHDGSNSHRGRQKHMPPPLTMSQVR